MKNSRSNHTSASTDCSDTARPSTQFNGARQVPYSGRGRRPYLALLTVPGKANRSFGQGKGPPVFTAKRATCATSLALS